MITFDMSQGAEASRCIFHVDAPVCFLFLCMQHFSEPDGGHLQAKPKQWSILIMHLLAALDFAVFEFIMNCSLKPEKAFPFS